MDREMKSMLWNSVKRLLLDNQDRTRGYNLSQFDYFCETIWHGFYKLPIDDVPPNQANAEATIRTRFFDFKWYEVYDFLEFLAKIDDQVLNLRLKPNFIQSCNQIFQDEFSGYRFIEGQIAPITNEHEIDEIETALGTSAAFTSFHGANTHLLAALNKISDRQSPDYRNSVKESISAVESLAKAIGGNDKDSLGAAIDKIKGRIKIHPSLEQGLKKIYGYTSDSSGIRHGLTQDNDCDFEDAKFMLVSCSAFINYLITKTQKAGISFQ